MDVRRKIKIKIDEFIVNNNLLPLNESTAPRNYQKYVLDGGFDDGMIDNLMYDLVGEEDALLNLLGKELYESQEFQNYYAVIKSIKQKAIGNEYYS